MIRFICVCIVVIGYLILSIPILLVEWVIGKFNKRAKDISSLRIIQAVFRFILKITGADITVKGHENVPADTAVLYIGNHRSFFDILLTYVLCPDVTGYVAKKEMESIPLLSIWMRYLHCLFLDRKNIKEGMKTILLAIEEMKKGISICIFPEGTRNRNESELDLLPFHEGSFKIATKAGTAVAGSVAGPEGTLIGMAAGEVAGMKIDNTFYKAEQRSRMMKFFMDKLKPNEEQNDSFLKFVGSMVRNKMTFVIKRAVSLLAPLITPILIIVIAATGIVFAVIAVLYNSPFALFLPPLESGDTIQSVTTQYVSEFNQEVQTLIDEHKDADKGRKVYVDYEGMNSEPSNYYDIMSVYMVKYGYENTATKMNETNKQNLKAVFDDMCKYTTENVTEKKGKKKTKYLEVRITLKTYTDMTTEYQFDEDRTATLNQLMSAYITNNSSGGSQISGLQGSLTPQEISNITDKISNPTQKAVVSFVLAKVGYPYSQPLRNSGKAFDCSSLAYYAWKSAGVDISFGGGTTAAAEAEGLKDKTVKEENLQPGDLIFYSYTTNGRYKNISHVGIYVGNGKVVEAVDEAHGVCLGDYHNGGLVMICRPGK